MSTCGIIPKKTLYEKSFALLSIELSSNYNYPIKMVTALCFSVAKETGDGWVRMDKFVI